MHRSCPARAHPHLAHPSPTPHPLHLSLPIRVLFRGEQNEFGDVGVDEGILSEKADEEVIEVMNGCICCTVRGDLVVALHKLWEKISKFDAIIIETTGLADPAPVAQTFFVDDGIQEKFTLDGIITVCDCKNILARLDDVKPEGVENEAEEQVAFADRILLNKTDLVDEAELAPIEARLKKLNPNAEIFRTQQSVLDPSNLIGITAFDLEKTLEMDPEFLDTDAEHEHDPSVASTSQKFDGFLNVNMLQSWISEVIQEMGANLFRYKGVLAVAGMSKKFVFQGVGMLFSGGFVDDQWKADEKPNCRFVFIGKNLDMQRLNDGFQACRCTEETRFKPGDKILTKVGKGDANGFFPGAVLKTWNEGNPYRIQLEDEESTNVWGPVDDDMYIKARA